MLPPGGRLEIETTLCREVRTECSPVVIDDVDQDPVYRSHHTPAMYGFKSYRIGLKPADYALGKTVPPGAPRPVATTSRSSRCGAATSGWRSSTPT